MSISPRASRTIAEELKALGAEMPDAPVSMRHSPGRSGTLATRVGGDEQAFAKVEPLLRDLGQAVTYIGQNGQGLMLKLAIKYQPMLKARIPLLLDLPEQAWFDVATLQKDIRPEAPSR